MSKILAAVGLALSASETVLGVNWLAGAKEKDCAPRRIFYGVVMLANAVMHVVMALEILEEQNASDAEWDDYDDYED